MSIWQHCFNKNWTLSYLTTVYVIFDCWKTVFVVCATWTQLFIFLAGVFLMVTFSIQCCATPEKNIQYESVLHVNNILQSILEHPLGNTTSKTKIINSASLWKVSCFIYSVLKNWGINIWISRIDWTLPCCYGNSKIVTKITWGSIYFN